MKPFALWFLLMTSAAFAQKSSIVGRWKTIDDETGKAVSIVEIYESKGKIFGRVAELLNPSDRTKTCSKCDGSDKDKPIMGLVVIKGLLRDDNAYKGKILDPKHGRIYECIVKLENKDKLKVRGYVGISLFGRTQYWHRVK
ncbi:DUF2147 domain-containing protein [Flavobacterium longum]|uniref:DUF2147 domain-containing protein n=1 Tax=Flavobacterium longum TaxID=1299340 RepID=UPI0039EAD76A